MHEILHEKKRHVVRELILTLGHRNREDLEASLNASTVLIDLIEMDKTFQIFLENDSEFIKQMVELAIDASNAIN